MGGRGGVRRGGTEGSRIGRTGPGPLEPRPRGRGVGAEVRERGAYKSICLTCPPTCLYLFIYLFAKAAELPFGIICAINYAFHLHDLH